jgi:HlyD family secretion protein
MRDMSRTRGRSEREARMGGNEVDNLDLQLARAREDLARITITAPAKGLLVLSPQGGWQGDSQLPRLGDWVSQGREVAQIVSLERMQVKLELNQAEIIGVKMGQQAEVSVEALSGAVLKGKVTAIGQTARRPPVQGWMGMSATATFPVTIDLPPSGKSLVRPGMRAAVRIVYRRIEGAITVPTGCIFRRDGHATVFVQRNGKFAPVAVTLGESNGDYTAITKGLKAGERIGLNDLGASAPTVSRASRSNQPKEPAR